VDNALELSDQWLRPGNDSATITLLGVLNAIDSQRQTLANLGEYDSIAHGLQYLKDIKRQLDAIIQTAEKDIYDLMTDKEEFIPGVGIVTKSMGSSKKWNSEELFDSIVARCMAGEFNLESVDKLLDTLKDCLPLTSSLSWRSGSLKAHGINASRYCETTYTRPTIRIQKDGGNYDEQ
jgi:hypothetical protein